MTRAQSQEGRRLEVMLGVIGNAPQTLLWGQRSCFSPWIFLPWAGDLGPGSREFILLGAGDRT